MSLLVRDAINFGTDCYATATDNCNSRDNNENLKREDLCCNVTPTNTKGDGNIPRPSIIKEEEHKLWPSMNFGGIMFDKDSSKILVAELEHSVAGNNPRRFARSSPKTTSTMALAAPAIQVAGLVVTMTS